MSEFQFYAEPPGRIRAIETRYRGYRFRSRLEARWAVFFDALEIRWDYEPEGFELGGGAMYLPDFFLHSRQHSRPGSGYWVEIKGQEPTAREIESMRQLCMRSDHNGYIFSGLPAERRWVFVHRSGNMESKPGTMIPDRLGEAEWIEISFQSEFPWRMCGADCDDPHLWRQKLWKAAEAAKSARFEHGERGVRA